MSTCKICKSKGRSAASRYDRKSVVCESCSLAEAFVNVKENNCVLQGGTPKSCGISFETWTGLVIDTRQRTTDRLIKHP